jgi:cobalt-precorrin-7 (C5)-methyltransferase
MISVVGMGPGNVNYLTAEAIETIQQADQVIAFGRIAETAEQIKTPVIRIKRVDEILTRIEPDKNIAILASGDPCFYGILEYLKKKNVKINIVIPGISSFQYLMAKLKKSWHPAKLVSLHGRDEEFEQIIKHPLSVLLTDKIHTPHTISKQLQEQGIKGKMYIGYNLSYKDEKIVLKNIGDDIEEYGSISVVVVEHEMD